MELLTKEIRTKMPLLGSQSEKDSKDVLIVVKFFNPAGSWTWYATEGSCMMKDGTEKPLSFIDEDPAAWDKIEDIFFFGLVRGFETELGEFSYNELKSVVGPLGLGIERDIYFSGRMLSEAQERQI